VLNIVSRSARTKQMGGQIKVYRNLVAGLDRIGYPYVVNRRLDAARFLGVHDDPRALPLLRKLPPDVNVIVGPNLYVMPRDMPAGLDLRRALYLHPSQWACDMWTAHGFNLAPLAPWPVGIDLDLFAPSPREGRTHILVYHKQRSPDELATLRSTLDGLGLAHDVIVAGFYKQADYLKALARAKYVIWHGRHESQGIALQEAMACDVPLLLWDLTTISEFWTGGGGCYLFTEDEKMFPTTAAPYFDARCGVRITGASGLADAIARMEKSWPEFAARSYVAENLSLEGQARELIALFERHWPDSKPWDDNRLLRDGPWRPPLRWIVGAVRTRVQSRMAALRQRLRGPAGA